MFICAHVYTNAYMRSQAAVKGSEENVKRRIEAGVGGFAILQRIVHGGPTEEVTLKWRSEGMRMPAL